MRTNYFLLLLIAALIFPVMLQAQRQVFFTESAGEGAPNAEPYPLVTEWTGWHNPGLTFSSGGIDSVADIRSTYVSAAATMPYPEGSGANNIYLASDAVTGIERGFAFKGINATEFKNIQLTFGYRKSLAEVKSDLEVSYWNGTEWVKVAFDFTEETEAIGWYRSPVINLPAEAEHADLGLRFVRPATSMNSIRIDDVWLTGEPKMTAAPAVNEATDIFGEGFTVSWPEYPGATGYLLDVSEKPIFSVDADTTTLVAWTFPASFLVDTIAIPSIFTPENADQLVTITATGNASNPIPYPAGGGTETSPYAFSSTGWENGVYKKYFQIDVNTTGYYNIDLSSWIYSSGNGPKHMKVQYRLGEDHEWIDVPNSDLVMPEAKYGLTSQLNRLLLPSACDNQPNVSVRWTMTSSLRTSGKSAYIVTSGGTSRIANIFVRGLAADVVTGYQSILVDGTSHTVTGLTVNKMYYYRVRATDGVYVSNASEVKEVSTVNTSVEKVSAAQSSTIFYDATADCFDVKLNGTSDVSVKVTDMSGRTLKSVTLSGKERSLSAAGLPAGVYIVSLTVDGETVTKKCIK